MVTLKLGSIRDEKPVRITAELPAAVHRDLVAYAELLGRETGQSIKPVQLVAPMLARFMATDRGFTKTRKISGSVEIRTADGSPAVLPRGHEPRSESA